MEVTYYYNTSLMISIYQSYFKPSLKKSQKTDFTFLHSSRYLPITSPVSSQLLSFSPEMAG